MLEKLIFGPRKSLNFDSKKSMNPNYMSHGNDDSPANYLIQTYYDYNIFVEYNPYASAKSGTLAESYILLQQFLSFFFPISFQSFYEN